MVSITKVMRWAAAVVALIVAACATPPPAASPDAVVSVNVLGNFLPRQILVEDLRHRRVGDVIQVNATVVNRTGNTLQVQYKPYWVDIQGFEVDDDAPWQPIVVNGDSQARISFVSRNVNAARVRIDIDKI